MITKSQLMWLVAIKTAGCDLKEPYRMFSVSDEK
jgi:hypothetical protein